MSPQNQFFSGTSFSRRNFLRASGLAAIPLLTEQHFALAQLSQAKPGPADTSGPVLLNANENPLGPSQAARDAVADMANYGGRYDFGASLKLAGTIQEIEGLKPGYFAIYAGSSEPLQYASLAFTSPSRSFVCADPTYEAGFMAAAAGGAQIHKIPLRADYSHDVKGMSTADANAGLIYICNPNNPTGTITTRADILWLLTNKPKNSVLLVDEAYIHFSDAGTIIDLALADKDIIVLRTFSKIYGMAGLRCGFAVARPDLLEKLAYYGMNAMPITASAAAYVSLLDKDLVLQRRKINTDIREQTFDWLKSKGIRYIPSQSNCFMMDVGRPGKNFADSMAKKNIYVGRSWPIWPNMARITVGTAEEMQRFRVSCEEVLHKPVSASAVHTTPPNIIQTPLSHLG